MNNRNFKIMKNLIVLFSFMSFLCIILISCRDAKTIEPELIEDEAVADNDDAGEAGSGNFDSNKDGSWDEEEFGNAFNRDFGNWDNNSDHHLNSEEFYSSTFATTDASGDYLITEVEWNMGREKVFRDFAGEGDFERHDINKDNQIDHKEWTQGFKDSDWFMSYDSNNDKRISIEEWKKGLFNHWDANKDKILNEEEYQAYSQYYT